MPELRLIAISQMLTMLTQIIFAGSLMIDRADALSDLLSLMNHIRALVSRRHIILNNLRSP